MTARNASLLPWAMWFLGALFYCYGFFQRVAPSVMLTELMRDFAVGATIAGVLSALYFYTYAGLQIPIGLLLDKWGPRRLITGAVALAALGSALLALAGDLGPAYLGRALIGAGAGMSWVGTLKIAALWFPPRRFALLTGLTMALGMAGAVGGQAPLSAAVAAIGWRGTMWVAAAVALILAAAMWLVVRDRPEPAPGEADSRHGLLEGLKVALTTPQTYVVGLCGSLQSVPMLAFAGLWGVPYMMRSYGLERADAALATSVMMVGWGIGAPVTGWFTDHIGRRKLPLVVNTTIGLVALTAALYLPLPLGAVYALFFVNGLAGGGMVLCFATAREHNPAWASGATLGVVNTTVMAGGAVFQPVIGWLLDRNWDGAMASGSRIYSPEAYAKALLVLPACQVTALVLALLVRETYCKAQR